MGKNFDKLISKNLSGKSLLIMLKNLQQMRLKLLQKEQFNLIDWLGWVIEWVIGKKSANRIKKFQKIHNKILQRQLQMSMIKKDIYLQKKDKKLMIN